MSFEPEVIRIAVAVVKTEDGVAITWNKNWKRFVLPMTKIGRGLEEETAEEAAVRALAEVAGTPCQVESGKPSHEMRQLQLSGRDGELKDYQFVLVPVRTHPDFTSTPVADHSVVMAPVEKLQVGEYKPLSSSVKPIIDECVSLGLV